MLAVDIATMGTTALIRVLVAFLVTYGAGLLLVFKGIADIVRSSNPLMEKFSGAWQKITDAVGKFNAQGKKGDSVMSQLTEGFNNFVRDNEPMIDFFLETLVSSIESTLKMMGELHRAFSDMGVFTAFGKMIGHVAGFVMMLVAGMAKLHEIGVSLFHWAFVGNSPSMLEVLDMMITSFETLGGVITGPLNLISKLIPDTEVANSTFNRSGDMESVNSALGDQIAMAVKEAMQGVEMNNKVQLEVVSQNGLPSLFDFVQRGMDDSQSGRSPQHALNAARAGIGKA